MLHFKRHTPEMLDQLRQTGRPIVLTVNGKAELVVQDAGAYQILLDRLEAMEAIQEGLQDVKIARTEPLQEAFESIRKRARAPAVNLSGRALPATREH